MSIDDEIRRKKQSMQAAVDAEARRQAEAKRLQDAMSAAGMNDSTPIIRMPSRDLQAVIIETMPRMIFKDPKIIRSLPDGTTRARHTQTNNNNRRERPDEYSFDVVVKTEGADKSVYKTKIWFFKNGSVAYTRGTTNDSNIDNPGVSASEVREKIIETIASTQVKTPPKPKSSTSKPSGGCYIATAVYGSYDCPEVWTLRRYRDYVLKPTWYGKVFIKTYYAFSPILVRLFGKKKWFQHFWKKRLDSITDNLQRKGFSDKPYDD